ncbi:hypothetical protein Dimus_030417 [Dionaea muscipula]
MLELESSMPLAWQVENNLIVDYTLKVEKLEIDLSSTIPFLFQVEHWIAAMWGNLRDSFPNASKWYAHVTSRLTARTNELEERLRTNGQSSLSGGTFYMSVSSDVGRRQALGFSARNPVGVGLNKDR